MKKLMLMFIVMSTLVCPSLYANPKILQVNSDRLVKVVGQVKDLKPQANTVLKLAKNSNKPIFIELDTPGGSVAGGLTLVRAIERVKTRGIDIICYVDGMSMSMGMHIMAACSKNYVLPTSLLMFHKIAAYAMFYKISEDNTSKDLKQLKLLGDVLDTNLQKKLGLSDKIFQEYLSNEYVQYGSNFIAPSFITVVDDYRFD